ncbi:MAG TPA: hypothetical protein VG245_05660 [Candidatus Dormibacteraeota bacterium]|jgi:hypothetical protein|nr:hypothetical protein [Candidatus Dormibacteraeota bacterium]
MRLRWRHAAPLLGIAALSAGVVAVEAATPTPAGTENPAQIFVDKLAGILHVSSSAAKDDIMKAQLATIDQLVKDGRLTAAQGAAAKQRIQSGQSAGPVPGFGFGFGGPGGRGRGPGIDRQVAMDLRTAELAAAASTLKVSAATLMSDLQSGQTIAQLETAAGVGDGTLRANLKSAARGVLDKAVKAGTLTQAQEDAMLQRIGAAGFGFFGGHRGRPGGPPPGGSAPPGGTAPPAGASPSGYQQS